MNDAISQALFFQPRSSRWKFTPLSRIQLSASQILPWRTVLAHGAFIGALFGLALTLGARFATGRWYLQPFLFAGSYGFLGGFAWAAMFRAAWNRRARHMQSSAASRLSPVTPPALHGLQRLLPPVYLLLFFCVMLALCVNIENLRGTLALRSYHHDLRARQEPLALNEILPPPIPEDQNLAAIPLLRPLWNTPVGPSGTPMPDTNAQARAKSIGTDDPSSSFRAFAAGKGRKQTGFKEGQGTDLTMRQAYYKSLPRWPQLPDSPPPSPAQSVLHALSRHEAPLSEIRTATTTRPHGRFPLQWDLPYYTMPLEHMSVLKGTVQVLALRAAALLAEQRPADAFADVELAQRVADMLRDDPLFISQLVRMSLETIILQPIWDGCTDHRWSPAELRGLRAQLAHREPIAAISKALQGERVYGSTQLARLASLRDTFFSPSELSNLVDSEFDTIIRFTPRGWLYFNDVAQGRYILALQDAMARARHHAELPPKGTLLDQFIDPKSPFNLLAALVAPGFDNAPYRAFENETWRRLALVGLALEEYRLAEGHYPENLPSLVPRFLDAPPIDPMDGHEMRYQREGTDGYRLYSVGPDHIDAGGKRSEKRSRNDRETIPSGDWVWR